MDGADMRQSTQSWVQPLPPETSQQAVPAQPFVPISLPSAASMHTPAMQTPRKPPRSISFGPLPPDARFAKPSNPSMASGFGRSSRASVETDLAIAQAPRLGSASSGSWHVRDIDWRFAITAQHYGTLIFTLGIVIALGILHWRGGPKHRPVFLYDASISYISAGDTVPASAAALVPFASLFITLCFYELWVYKYENWHITNAVATIIHFMLDGLCAFVTVATFTEATKLAAGRLRPDFFQQCQPVGVNWTSGPVLLGQSDVRCPADSSHDGRKSFCSGHSSTSAVLVAYNIAYLLWAGYIRGDDAAFMGLDKRTGWRGGRRLLRELGHGAYLMWMLLNFVFTWAVGVSRFTDNKHNISDILGGWFLGFAFAVIYAVRSTCLHKYVVMHNVHEIEDLQRSTATRPDVEVSDI